MGKFFNPNDSVYKTITLPYWQKQWINSHHSINFSGLVQGVLIKIIEERDPAYFKEHKYLLEERDVKRKENTEMLVLASNKLASI